MLKDFDKEIKNLIDSENKRQDKQINLIASENCTSEAVLEAVGSCLVNKYSEGNVGKRYYAGCKFIDKIEQLCIDRALTLFDLDKDKWHVNVQAYSGSIANFAIYNALLNPGDRIMGMDLNSGGHLSHGFKTKTRKVSSSSKYFNSMSYEIGPDGYIDYDKVLRTAMEFLPNILIVGASSYPRDYDYKKFREIAYKIDAYLMVDISHTSGLIASNLLNNPFDYADVVMSTTHKTLRGPRGAMIFCKKKLSKKIDSSVFPSIQGGPHNQNIAGIAVALKMANTKEFADYSRQVIYNAKVLVEQLKFYGYNLVTYGTDNHTILWNLRDQNISGKKMQEICEEFGIILNKNSIIGDTSAISPGGVRLGTSFMTTKGFKEKDFKVLGFILHNIILHINGSYIDKDFIVSLINGLIYIFNN